MGNSVVVVVPPSLPTRYTRDERTNRVPSLSIIIYAGEGGKEEMEFVTVAV